MAEVPCRNPKCGRKVPAHDSTGSPIDYCCFWCWNTHFPEGEGVAAQPQVDPVQAEREAIAQALEREVQEMQRASLELYDHEEALDSAVLTLTLLVSRIRKGELTR